MTASSSKKKWISWFQNSFFSSWRVRFFIYLFFFLEGDAFLLRAGHTKILKKVKVLKLLEFQIAQMGDLSQSWGLHIFKNSGPGLSQRKRKNYFFDPKLIFSVTLPYRAPRKQVFWSRKKFLHMAVQGFRSALLMIGGNFNLTSHPGSYI